VVQGLYEELQGDEAANAFRMLYEKLFRGVESSWVHPHKQDTSVHKRDIRLDSAIVYRIRIREKTGRFERR
jgi:nitroimidazol reductase NimA-like FMN-containing flavoprotein (pyridoxamine 5'-phosphate oxidase superfamily)